MAKRGHSESCLEHAGLGEGYRCDWLWLGAPGVGVGWGAESLKDIEPDICSTPLNCGKTLLALLQLNLRPFSPVPP